MANLSAIIAPTNVETASNTSTLSNKTISGASNTLSNIPLATAVTGTLPVANGGTGLTTTPANGALDIGNGTGFTRATLTAGSNVTITNASGAITIAASGGASAATPTALGTVYGKQTTVGGTPFLTAYGYNAGGSTTGVRVTSVGTEALYTNSTGARNTALGNQAGYSNNGDNNLFIGVQSGFTNTTGTANSFVGGMTSANFPPGYYNETGSGNTYIGSGAGFSTTTGAKNTIVGSYSGNQDGLDIRTASNYAVISDGDGNRLLSTANGQTLALDSAVPNSGTGITFPAGQSASTNAHTLDDYEEGTWTPTILFGGNGVGQSYTYQIGTYTKIGRMVQLNFFVLLSNKGSSTGQMSLGGAPFTPTSFFTGAVDVHNTTYTGMYVTYGFVITQVSEAGAQSDLTHSNASNTSVITGTINHIV